MSDAQVQGVGESSHSHSAEVHDTVERHQEKGKYREGSMRTILDNLRQQNETTSLLLRSLHEHFQNQNKLLETLTAKPIPNSTSVPEPQAAGSGAESTHGRVESSAPLTQESPSVPRNQRSKSCADEAVSAKEINDEPVWLQTRRLDPERVTELFQVLLEALRLSRCRSQTTDVELFIKDQRVPIKNLDWRQLESLLAPEWPAANSSKPLWEIELDYEHRSTPRVRVFRDVEGGVESVNSNMVRGDHVAGFTLANASDASEQVLKMDGLHIDLPPRFIPDSEYSDCITFGDVFLAISQLGKAQGIARRVSLITGYVDSLLNHYICPINSGVFDHDIWWHADYVGQSYTLIISGLRSERTAVKESLRRPRRDGPVSGLGLLRKRGTLPSPSPVSKTTFSVLERRTMFCVHLFPDLARHRLFYSLVTSTWEPHAVLNLRAREVASVYKPLYIYLWFVRIELNAIQKDWTEVLDLLDGELNVTLKQVSTVEGVEDLLFDDLALSTSRKYFILLQHLRIYEEWIVGTCKGLSSWSSVRNAWLEFYIEPAIRRMDPGVDDLSRQTEDLLTAWEGTVRTAKHGFEPILTRIRAKRDEIVTLRDGLFNATAVREALQSSRLNEQGLRLNRYVLIFTITTIIYLPLSFVTGFFGMNNLSATSLTATLNPFAWMAIAFCMGTYIFTFGGLGLYALNEKRKQNKRSANVHGQQINSGILHENSIYGQLSTTVNIDGISSDTSIDEQPSAASVEAQASSSHEQSPATSEREQEFSDAAAANSVTRRARDVFSHATIPLRTLRTRRKQRAGTESQA